MNDMNLKDQCIASIYRDEDSRYLVFNTRNWYPNYSDHLPECLSAGGTFIRRMCKCPSPVLHPQVTVWNTHGDCCTQSYFYEIEGIDNLIGQYVIDIIFREIKREDVDDNSCHVRDIHAVEIVTDKGIGIIFMRAEHNGYYGGEILDITSIQFRRYSLDEKGKKIVPRDPPKKSLEEINLIPVTKDGVFQ